MRLLTLALVLAMLSACAPPRGAQGVTTPSPPADASASAGTAPTGAVPTPTAPAGGTGRVSTCGRDARCDAVLDAIGEIDVAKMEEHLVTLASFVSRDPRHPGHARAAAYIKERLGALGGQGVRVETHRAQYQGIPLENIFAVIDPVDGARESGWVLVSAHYDSIASRTAGWRPATDPAPGADDNATGTAALLEYARILSRDRALLRERVVLAFFDGEELFFKGSGAYVSTLQRPYPYKAAINLDMVGFNPIADRLDLLWYTSVSAELRDRAIRTNDTYDIGVSPLVAQYAADGSTIMDAAPFGLAGIPSIALCQRYGGSDATFPGNETFHTVNDTPDKVTNRRLWLKAARLTLAIALDLARETGQ